MNIISSILFFAACSDVEKHDHDHHDHEHEVMTTLVLTFTAQSDGSVSEFSWADPENDGSPVIDDIFLQDADDYDLSLSILNELEDPVEDVTPEIADEADEHQVFFTGTAVQGPSVSDNADAVIEQAYADEDDNGLPLGLSNAITTLATGTGKLTVTLRHMPPENDNPVKIEGLAADVSTGGFDSIGGADDISVTFNLAVE